MTEMENLHKLFEEKITKQMEINYKNLEEKSKENILNLDIPKLNLEYIELEQRMKNNRDRAREIYNRALSLENAKFALRVFTQKPRFMHTKFLEKLYEENYQTKSPKRTINKSINTKKLRVYLPKISGYKDWRYSIHSRTEANLDDDNDNEIGNNSSVELKEHGQKETKHQRQGHIEGQHRGANNNNLETTN